MLMTAPSFTSLFCFLLCCRFFQSVLSDFFGPRFLTPSTCAANFFDLCSELLSPPARIQKPAIQHSYSGLIYGFITCMIISRRIKPKYFMLKSPEIIAFI